MRKVQFDKYKESHHFFSGGHGEQGFLWPCEVPWGGMATQRSKSLPRALLMQRKVLEHHLPKPRSVFALMQERGVAMLLQMFVAGAPQGMSYVRTEQGNRSLALRCTMGREEREKRAAAVETLKSSTEICPGSVFLRGEWPEFDSFSSHNFFISCLQKEVRPVPESPF